MKKIILFLLNVILAGVMLSGCSSSSDKFNDEKIHFKLISHKTTNQGEFYTIQIKSALSIELTHLELYLSYPIKIPNGSKTNPFSIKGKTTNNIAVNLKKGQSAQFTFDAPIKEVFGNSKLLDFKNPSIKLVGYSKEGNKEIPFGMGGGLEVFLNKYK